MDEVLVFQIPFSRRRLWLEREEAPVAREGALLRRRDLLLRQAAGREGGGDQKNNEPNGQQAIG